jgi:hypothetical protein
MAAGRVTDAIEGLESILGLSFTDKHVLLESLLTPGCGIARAGARSCPDGNKRLAVLGDTVLKLLVITDHYDTGAPRRKTLPNSETPSTDLNIQVSSTTMYSESPITAISNARVSSSVSTNMSSATPASVELSILA